MSSQRRDTCLRTAPSHLLITADRSHTQDFTEHSVQAALSFVMCHFSFIDHRSPVQPAVKGRLFCYHLLLPSASPAYKNVCFARVYLFTRTLASQLVTAYQKVPFSALLTNSCATSLADRCPSVELERISDLRIYASVCLIRNIFGAPSGSNLYSSAQHFFV